MVFIIVDNNINHGRGNRDTAVQDRDIIDLIKEKHIAR